MDNATKLEIFGYQELVDAFDKLESAQRRGIYVRALRKSGMIMQRQAKENFRSIYKKTGEAPRVVSIRFRKNGKLKLTAKTPVDRFLNKIVVSMSKDELSALIGGVKEGVGRLFHLFESGTKPRTYLKKGAAAGFYKSIKRSHYTGRMTASHFFERAYDGTNEEMMTTLRKEIFEEFAKLLK